MKDLLEKIKQNFEFFEKKQGRPSKETIKKRKTFYITLVLIFVLILVGITSFTLSKINKNKLKGETLSSSETNFTFSEDRFDNNEKYYNYYIVGPSNISNYQIIIYFKNSSGSYNKREIIEVGEENKKVNFSLFSKNDETTQYKVAIRASGNANNWKPRGWKVDASNDNIAYAEFIVDSNSSHVYCINDVVSGGTVNTFVKSNLSLIKRIINMIYRIFGQKEPYDDIKESKQVSIVNKTPSEEINTVSEAKIYTTTFKLRNDYDAYAFYKIVKYNSLSMNPSNMVDKGTCTAFKGSSVTANASFTLDSLNKEAVGVLKVFLSKELCEAEMGDYTASFESNITKYKYNGSSQIVTTTTKKTTTTTKKTTTTTTKATIVPKMILSKIIFNDAELGNSTANKTINGKSYAVHEIKNVGTVNLVYNSTTGVSGTYYRRLNIYNSFDGTTPYYSSTCREYNEFNGVAKDDFTLNNSGNKNIKTEFAIYTDSSCKNLYNGGKSNTYDYFLYSGSTTTTNNITITLSDKSGLKSNNNIVTVSSTGDYSVKAVVTQTNNATLYYRWDTYTGVNADNHSYSDTLSHGNYSYCSSFTDNSITFDSLERLEYDYENTPRSGKFSLYSSQSDCENSKNAVKSAIIGYKVENVATTSANTGTNTGNYKTVKYDFNEIKTKFGAQAPSECYKAAMTYAAWIAQGINRSDIMRHSTDYSRSEWGSNSYDSGGTTKDVYKLIINRINAGKPIVVHGSCRSGYYWSHWVTVVGYKNGVTADNATASDFLVIDPVEPKIKTLQEALPGGLGGSAYFERIWW